ncbi:putative Interferon-related developmental regulator 1 [Hypsibius exemplaris]|uniref:Interferon-related developmental regulator 1 n=1 Tax=Hypsibius exemplaris TaxID=2072580 RepID=A0A1W0WFV2_HYPEX|nr:putative Interferon-related developmental regulator 1 [Hypsibius exemplaris]
MPRKGKKDYGIVKADVSPDGNNEDAGSEVGTHISSLSDTKTTDLDAEAPLGGEGQAEFTGSLDQLEDKLKDAIEKCTDSSVKSRETALAEINLGLERRLLYDFIVGRVETFADIVERSLRRGKSAEQNLAARLSALLCVQLGGDCGEFFNKVRSALLTTYSDVSVSALARAACAEALGIGSFIADEEPDVFNDTIRRFSKTFSASYLKGDHTSPIISAEVSELHRQSLLSWSLLLSVASDGIITEEVAQHLHKLPDLLETGDTDFRIASGESIALMNEMIRDLPSGYSKMPELAKLCLRLRELSTESTKHKAKKDKKQQRSSFREILHSIEDGDGSFQRIRFGKEVLDLHTWRHKLQYEALCSVLHTGINYHLRANPLIRDIFDLGDPLPESMIADNSKKGDKFLRQMQQDAADKDRSVSRNLHRNNKQAATRDLDED